jgi:hypothetical protein
MVQKSTTNEFISKSISIHNDNYDYSKVNYKNNYNKIIIICKVHGEFEQLPINHLSGSGCFKCGAEKSSKSKMKKIEIFISEAKAIHGSFYNYSKVNYKNNRTNIEIICPIHCSFWQTPNGHITNRSGCPKCNFLLNSNNKINKAKNFFIEKAQKIHGYKYDYSKSDYKKANTNIVISCIAHGDFLQSPNSHLNGSGCNKCAHDYLSKKFQMTTEQFIVKAQKIHGFKYDYSHVYYTGIYNEIIINCKNHGLFYQIPNIHLRNHGCPKCAKIISKSEVKWLDSLNVKEEYRHLNIKIQGKLIKTDAYNYLTKTIYEFYGDFWHGNPKMFDPNMINDVNGKTFGELYNNTLKREKFILENGYKIISIWECDWKIIEQN